MLPLTMSLSLGHTQSVVYALAEKIAVQILGTGMRGGSGSGKIAEGTEEESL